MELLDVVDENDNVISVEEKGVVVSPSTIWSINRRLRLQSPEEVWERTAKMDKETGRKLHERALNRKKPCLFSPEEKWGMLIENQGNLKSIIISQLTSTSFHFQEVEDLLQDTLVRGFSALDNVKSKSNALVYLQAVARNTVADYMKKRFKQNEVPLDDKLRKLHS